MDSQTRKNELKKIMSKEENKVMTGVPLRYKGETKQVNVWRIPLDYLVYNKYNGRIGSDVLSYETQKGELNAQLDSDKKIIEKFLYNSNKDRNEKTLKSLVEIGQQRHGIVTSDGIIVDGNRRAMLLNHLFYNYESLKYNFSQVEKCKYFLAIILSDDATETDIQQLETIYQMGEDDKLDYNPIEKYLKCKQLSHCGFTSLQIAEFMNEKESQIKKWLDILKLMEEYLQEYGYNGIYTRLEKTEGPFVDLEGYLDSYKKKGANVADVDWEYDDADIANLKLVCFDYIRARYEGKEFRNIAKTGKAGSIFFYGDLWKKFFEEHSNNIPSNNKTVDDLRQEKPDEDLDKLLQQRDDAWTEQAKGKLKGNLNRFSIQLENKRDANKPADLIQRALDALQSVDCNQESFIKDPEIEKMVKEINKISWDMKKRLEKN